ncbi:MAG: hypothetical protein ACREGB_02830 [Candidatus Saccharimonadales bacterium]
MAAPTKHITSNFDDSHQSSPGWICAFSRFKQPASIYTERANLNATKPLMIVENDCVNVSVTNAKSSLGKQAVIRMKAGDVFYPNAVACGDWVIIWMHEDQDDTNKIALTLRGRGNTSLNNYFSGLKFIGRVIGIGAAQQVSQQGVMTVQQTITCQAFLELASSVYFTDVAMAALGGVTSPGSQFHSGVTFLSLMGNAAQLMATNLIANADNVIGVPPDKMIQFLFSLLLNIDSSSPLVSGQTALSNAPSQLAGRGSFNNTITIPADVATVTGNPGAKSISKMYNCLLGVQNYSNQNNSESAPWISFSPKFASTLTSSDTYMFTPNRCKGWADFMAPNWSNVSIWNILGQYLNDTLNEMYTVLRCDQFNRIRPTLVVREKPFGTGLFNRFGKDVVLNNVAVVKKGNKADSPTSTRVERIQSGITQSAGDAQNPASSATAQQEVSNTNIDTTKVPLAPGPQQSTARAMYCELPRWVIDDSMVRHFAPSFSEHDRVNFVQVWGTNAAQHLGGAPVEGSDQSLSGDAAWRAGQFAAGNYVYDYWDVSRNGLRSLILESPFDKPTGGNGFYSSAPFWARIVADHNFNGHLKAFGSMVLYGVTAPICEGDNMEFQGVVYHIEVVEHRAACAPNGVRTFETVLTVNRGMLAQSLRTAAQIPRYAIHVNSRSESHIGIDEPGITDIEQTTGSDRDQASGEKIRQGQDN